MVESGRPSYRDLVELLKEAPARQAISDQRYWDWKAKADAILDRVPQVG